MRIPDPFRPGRYFEIRNPEAWLAAQHGENEERQKRCAICRFIRARLKEPKEPTGFEVSE